MMKPIILSIFLGCCFFCTSAQQKSIVDDTVLLRLTITDYDHHPLKTMVSIGNKQTKQVRTASSNQLGLAEVKLPTGSQYEITIQHSTDSYDYEVPDIANSPEAVTLPFHLQDDKASNIPVNYQSVGIRVLNNNAVTELLVRSDGTAPQTYTFHNDTCNLLLKQGQVYTIEVPGASISNAEIRLKDGISNSYVLSFSDKMQAALLPMDKTKSLINVVYTDLEGKPAKGEPIVVKGAKGAAEYRMTTGENGTATCVVPQNDVYEISLQHYPNVFTLPLKQDDVNNTIATNNVRLEFPTSAQYKEAKVRDERRIAERDSLYALESKAKEQSEQNLQKALAEKSLMVKKALHDDSLYFEKSENIVCAVLYRNRHRWPARMIVTDVTGSMYPYMEQLTLWHMLELMDKRGSDYVFFNDGDNKPDGSKILGNTGGIYYCAKSNAADVVKTMYKAMRNGGGGDGPENDLEALLFAQKERAKNSEIILVADNFSNVKDIALLSKLNVPVRVVLCGTGGTWVNVDYLDIAYATGGSVHTIEEDIVSLASLHEGDQITINKGLFVFRAGRFFQLAGRF